MKMNDEQCDRLMKQVSVARCELNNLRQKMKALHYRHENEMKKLWLQISNINWNPAEEITNKLCHSRHKEIVSTDFTGQWRPIGYIRSAYPTKSGTPRQGAICATTDAQITISKDAFTNPEHALEGIDQFSHVWLLYLFHRNEGQSHKAKVSPPRLNGSRVGVFGTRSPHRPNPIGLTLATVTGVSGDTLHVQGVDAVDGTPVLDVKPYIPQYDDPVWLRGDENREEVRVAEWIGKPPAKRLSVDFTVQSLEQLKTIVAEGAHLTRFKSEVVAREELRAILAEDPRPCYRRRSKTEDLYYFDVDGVRVTCWFDEGNVLVLKVKAGPPDAHLDK